MESNWISVKDRLPKSSVSNQILFFVVINGCYKMYFVGYFNINKCRFESGEYSFSLLNVTHWMPLPEPPKQ